jgi:DNA polymerase elongation subunit (family B)
MFVREYLRERRAMPRSEWGSQSVGGYTDLFRTGAVGPVVYADVESLYPSIMLADGIQPKGDTLDLFPRLLRRLTDLRFEAKRQMKAADEESTRGELDARQSSYKVLINSFYGSLGFSLSTFNDFEEADKVTRRGQELLQQMIGAIKRRGGEVIEADTDGVFFVPPETDDAGRPVRGDAEAEQRFTEDLTGALPEGIRVGFDGRYRRMLSYKKKNYALLGYDDELKFKGSSLVARSSERFGRRFVRRAVRLILKEDLDGLHDLYVETRAQVEASDWPEGASSFARTETLKDSLRQYEDDVEHGKRTRTAPYELARRMAEQEGRDVRKGDRISYYITGSGKGVTAFKNCALAEEWTPDAPDENTAYYLARLDRFTEKFEPFFEEHDFRRLFSPEDLFGFSADGIQLQTERHEPEGRRFDDEVPF